METFLLFPSSFFKIETFKLIMLLSVGHIIIIILYTLSFYYFSPLKPISDSLPF